MSASEARLVLAFDASCGTCREVSAAVAQACGGRLEVLPLAHDDVRRWRAQTLGPAAPWTPTLLRVRDARVRNERERDDRGGDDRVRVGRGGDDRVRVGRGGDGAVRAWTGTAMGVALIRHLGPRATIQVLRALGELRRHGTVAAPAPGRTLSRAGFFQLAAGVVAAGAIMAKASPVRASTYDAARAWVEANKDRLPQRYDEFVRHPMAHRRAIFAELTPEARSRLWEAHLQDYAATHPGLSARQRTALRNAAALTSTTAVFAAGRSPELLRGMDDVARQVRQAFGPAEARTLVATLGPAEPLGAPACNCASVSDFCNDHCSKGELHCVTSNSGCGLFWVHPCDGLCVT